MKKCGIYKIVNPNNNIYIGASNDILKRWNVDYKYICNVKSQKLLHSSFKKYGIKNHIFEIIEECDKKILFEREIYWINYYNSYKKGLNLTKGGENPPLQLKPLSAEHKRKIGLANKGKNHTEETKQKIKEKRKNQIFTKEQILKASNSRKGKPSKLKGRKRPIISEKLKGKITAIAIKCILINIKTNEIIKANSIQELSRKSKISVTSILKIRSGKIVNKYKDYEYKQ